MIDKNWKKIKVINFSRKIGLPYTFENLTILGLYKVVDSKDLSLKNKKTIFRFLNHISSEVSDRRLTFYTHKLRHIGKILKKDFDKVTEENLRSLLTYLIKGKARKDGGVYSSGTIHGYKVSIKRFYRWLEGDDEEYPKKVRWIKTSGDTTRIHEPEQLLTFKEVRDMIRHAKTPRDKAIVAFLYESGARTSEMLSMKIRHIEFSVNLVRATLPVSKTRPRVIPLYQCKKHLSVWMNYHPLKDDPEAPLWSSLRGDGNRAMMNQNVGSLLKSIALKAGIQKRVYPHLFRACSITHKQAKGMPEQLIKAFHGLSKDSTVMKHYSHIGYNDLENYQNQMNGLPVEPNNDICSGVRCSSCGKSNPLYIEVCECGLPTDVKLAPKEQVDMEAEIQKRVEKNVLKFIENRGTYDHAMEKFLHSLLEKTKESPELLNAVKEVGAEINGQIPSLDSKSFSPKAALEPHSSFSGKRPARLIAFSNKVNHGGGSSRRSSWV